MRIAVFGGRGFIGKAFVQGKPQEHELFLLNRPEADVEHVESFAEKLKDIRPDVVVNLAARIGTLLTKIPVRDMFKTNTMGSLNVAYAAHEAGARAYVFTSSTVVHGENKNGEHHGRFDHFAPKHPYSASKAAAEFGLQQYAHEQKKMAIVTLRPPMVIGEGTDIPLPPIEFVQTALQGGQIQIFGEGLHEREFVSVADTADGVWRAIGWGANAGEGYHPFFLTGNRISMRLLAEKVAQKFGGKVVYTPKTVQAFSLTTDPVDSKRLFGWEVEDDLERILDDVARFVSSEKQSA